MVRATSGSVTGSWGTGQTRIAGDLLVAIVTAGGSTASAAAISTPSGWSQVTTIGNTTGSANAWVAAYTKTAAGSDAAPAFTATLSGTVAMTATLIELPAACNFMPADAYGTYSSGGSAATLSAMTATTGTSVSATGGYAIAAFVQERAAATNTWNGGSGWSDAVNDGTTSSVLHTAVDIQASPTFNAAASETGHWTTGTTAFGAGLILVIAPQVGGIEVYTNNASTTITAGGTDAPVAGTPEYWTGGWAGFPVASNTAFPVTKFYVNDPLVPGEDIAVLNTSTGLVVRGANGTTPAAHAVPFTIQNVLTAESSGNAPQTYTPRQYGAYGDGTHDDFIPLQEAFTAARLNGGGTVDGGSGTYLTSQIPQIGSNTRLTGDGPGACTIRVQSSMSPVQIGSLTGITALQVHAEQSASGILIENVTFDGNEAGNTSIPSPFTAASSAAIRLDNVDKLKIRNVEIIGAIGYSAWLNNCTHYEVSGCKILSGQNTGLGYSGQDGVHVTNSQVGAIFGNTVDTGTSATTGGDAICLQSVTTSAGGGSAAAGGGPNPTSSVSVTGNVLRAAGRGVSMLAGGTAVSSVTISGNTVWTAQGNAVAAAWVTAGTGVHTGITITGNTFTNINAGGAGNGVVLGNPAMIPATGAPGWADVAICGNTFSGFSGGTGTGIYAAWGTGLSITGNILDDFDAAIGIQVGDNSSSVSWPVSGFTISGNTVNMADSTATGAFGIAVLDGTNGSVAGNAVTGNSLTSSIGIILAGGPNASPACSNVTVSGNSLTDWPQGVAEAYYGTTPDYNTILDNNTHGCTAATVVLGPHTLCQISVPDIGGIPDTEQYAFLTSTYTLTSSTSAQALFNVGSSSTGKLTVPAATAFFFECEFDLSSLSATSGTFSFSLGGTATYSYVKYWSSAQKSAVISTLATWQSAVIVTSSATALVSASTTTTGAARLSGIIRTLAAGTLIPTITLSQASAAVVGSGSWFRIWPAGASTATTAGFWT
jgi:hypothetical protein